MYMKIRVQQENGNIETIDVCDTAEVQVGNQLDRLVTQGAEHFFTKDGYYDGWGRGVSCSPSEAKKVLNQTELKRNIEPRTQTASHGSIASSNKPN